MRHAFRQGRDPEAAGVGRDDRVVAGDGAHRVVDRALDVQILERRFDDQIDVAQRVDGAGRRDPRQRGVACGGVALAARDLLVERRGDPRPAGRRGVRIAIHKRDGETAIRRILRDARAHGARADHAELLYAVMHRASSPLEHEIGPCLAPGDARVNALCGATATKKNPSPSRLLNRRRILH